MLKIAGTTFLLVGFIVCILAKKLVLTFNFDKKLKCNIEDKITKEEADQYKYNKAIAIIKMLGLAVSFPGFLIILLEFK